MLRQRRWLQAIRDGGLRLGIMCPPYNAGDPVMAQLYKSISHSDHFYFEMKNGVIIAIKFHASPTRLNPLQNSMSMGERKLLATISSTGRGKTEAQPPILLAVQICPILVTLTLFIP